MKFRDIWHMARPLLWEAIRWYAPQIKIPADIVKAAGKYIRQGVKASDKLKKRIFQLDKLIDKTQRVLDELRAEREDMILDQADLYEFMNMVAEYKRGRRANGQGN